MKPANDTTMISDDTLLLITAAVDGELSQPETGRLALRSTLLSRARTLYEKLRADRDRLCAMPTIPPPANLVARVMARIASLTPTPVTVPARRPEPSAAAKLPPGFPWPWQRVSCLASREAHSGSSLAITATRASRGTRLGRPPAANQGANEPNGTPLAAHSPLPSAPMPSERGGDGFARNSLPVAPHPEVIAIAPLPRMPDRDLLGAHPPMDLPRFDLVEVRLPFLKSLSDFDRDDVRLQLTEELGQDPAFRIDLFTRNLTRGVELFQSAARASGLVVHADGATLNYLKKGQLVRWQFTRIRSLLAN